MYRKAVVVFKSHRSSRVELRLLCGAFAFQGNKATLEKEKKRRLADTIKRILHLSRRETQSENPNRALLCDPAVSAQQLLCLNQRIGRRCADHTVSSPANEARND